GTWRFDQVTVSGTAVPEPSAAAGLLSLGFIGGGAQLVRNRRKVQA
ncbi:MAG: PEP-CTERM sorting domain-containing protein, partial [Anaerolineae bacterium]|nr:PEP-CTERM sorting domain-containing protein [Gloeobacterales cyanobacterium ES-bin-313]